uniref:Uncharacterized protein n=1 Tax=Oryza brachyantha TaxID=4533 RepID=J3N654_ORYBR
MACHVSGWNRVPKGAAQSEVCNLIAGRGENCIGMNKAERDLRSQDWGDLRSIVINGEDHD